MLIQFNHQWLEAVWQYCHRHAYETLEITYYLMRFRIGASLSPKRDGNLYLSVDGDQINGVAFFNVKGVLFVSFETEDIFRKVDFLKTIHKEQPRLVRGQREQVDRLFRFLQRTLKDFGFHKMQLMVMGPKPNLSPVALEAGFTIADAHQVDWLKNGKFLLAVEQHFRAQTLTINNLRHKIHQRQEFDFYTLLLHQERAVGQVVGEFSTDAIALIGGLYIVPALRKLGLGRYLCLHALETIVAEGKQPALYVADDNLAAIDLYKQLGFVCERQMLDMSIKL